MQQRSAIDGQQQGTDTADLMARVARLERENRWFKSATLLALLAGAALVVMAPGRREQGTASGANATVVDEVRAKRFVVVDGKGVVRATLDTQDMGWPYLSRAGLTLYATDNGRKVVVAADSSLNQVSLESNHPGEGAKYARMQVGNDGVGLELSEFLLQPSRQNLFGVHWTTPEPATPGASTIPGPPRLEMRGSAPDTALVLTPDSPKPATAQR